MEKTRAYLEVRTVTKNDGGDVIREVEAMGFEFVDGRMIDFRWTAHDVTMLLFKPTKKFDPKDQDATVASIEQNLHDGDEGGCLQSLIVEFHEMNGIQNIEDGAYLTIEWIQHC